MRLITAEQTSEILGVNLQRTYELARRPDVFPQGIVVRLGRQIRFNEDALRDWIRRGGRPSSPCEAEPGGLDHAVPMRRQ
jgi:predicted DNA-binding transcriptional regulator AlpA